MPFSLIRLATAPRRLRNGGVLSHVEPADDPAFVWLRTSATPNPERKPAMLVKRDELNAVLLMLCDAAQTEVTE